MTESQSRHVTFEHEGHRFVATETRTSSRVGDDGKVHWRVTLDGAEVLEFHGAYPFRDDEVQARVIEWYEIQKPRT